MKKKLNQGIILIILAVICVIVVGCIRGRKLELNYIEQIHMNDGLLYYVDRGNDNYFRIICSNTNGENGKVIECSRHEKEKYRTISQMFFGENGAAYALMTEIDVDSAKETSSRIYLCDFKAGKLIETDISVMKSEVNCEKFTIQEVRNEKIYFFATVADEDFQGLKLRTLDENEKIEELDTLPLQAPHLWNQAFVSQNNIILWMDNEGEIFIKEAGTDHYLTVEGVTGIKGRFKNLSNDGENTVFFLDYQEESIKKIDLTSLEMETVCTEGEVQKEEEAFQFEELANLMGTDHGFFAGVQGDSHSDFTTICGYQDGIHKDIEGITLYLPSVIHTTLEESVWVLVAAVILILYWIYYCRYQKQTILIPIILVFVVGLFLANSIFERWVERTIREQTENAQVMVLSALGEQIEKQIIEKLNEDPGQLLSGNASLAFGTENDKSKFQQTISCSYAIVKADDNGQLYIKESMYEYSNVPVERYFSKNSVEKMYTVLETGVQEKVSEQQCYSLYIPLQVNAERTYGILILTFNDNVLEYQLWYYQWNLRIISTGIMGIISLLQILVMIWFLRPLNKLRGCAEKMAAGDLGLTVPVHGHDEVARISEAFNRMSTGIETHVKDIQELSDGYYKFIPAKILKLMGKDSIKEVRLGDKITTKMTIMTLYAENYHKHHGVRNIDKVFEVINRVLSGVVEPITDHQGVVEHFEESGLSAFFTEDSQSAIDTAIKIHQTMDSVNEDYKRTVAITYGNVVIGVIGHENRMEATSVSTHSNLAKALRYKGEKYGARILITNLVYHQIPDFEKNYHARYLGNVYLNETDTIERLYDVYDGDTEEEFYYKELTKPLFEKGVELFVAKRFYEARLVFVEVLKQHRKDKAAKEYLYRCDRYYKMADVSEADTMLERF